MTATGTGILHESAWLGKAFNGAWIATAGGAASVLEKATGKTLSKVGLAVAADVRASAATASAAQQQWAAMP